MKQIEALFATHQLCAMRDLLLGTGLVGFTILEVLEFRSQGDSIAVRLVGKERDGAACLKLEVVVHDDLVTRVVDAILRLSRSERMQAHEIRVVPVAEALRIRTEEIDEAAIA